MFPFTREGRDEEAWRVLFEQNYAKVYRIALRILLDKRLAEAATAEAFSTAFSEIKTLKDKSKFSAWICTIAQNTAKNNLKQEEKRRRKVVSYDDRDSWVSLDRLPIRDTDNPEIQYEEKEAKEEILKILGELDSESRKILYMKYYKGYTYVEIAKELDRKESAVRVKALRAREKIYKKLSKDSDRKGQDSKNG